MISYRTDSLVSLEGIDLQERVYGDREEVFWAQNFENHAKGKETVFAGSTKDDHFSILKQTGDQFVANRFE